LLILLSQIVWAQVPTISDFNPKFGPVGTTVTITGTNFSTTAANNIVYFGAVKAVMSTASSISLTVTVPYGATYQPISVTVNGLTAYSAKPFIVTFAGGGSISSSSFAPKVDFTTGSAPEHIAIADFDGDGKPDLVATNGGSNTVSVFRNTSISGNITGTSFAKVDFVTGVTPNDVTIGDLDGDGKPDLAVTNGGSNTVSVFRNTSSSGSITSSSFAIKVDFATGSNPCLVAIGDLDGDGKPDLAVTNWGGNTVSVFRNLNTGPGGSITSSSFDTKVDFAVGSTPIGVAIGDLDGDGKPDLLVTSLGSNTLSVFRNTSVTGSITNSSFAARMDFAAGSGTADIVVGDLDGDGKPDVAVTNHDDNTISVFRNTSTIGSITFAAKVDFATGSTPYVDEIGDLDGDGKPDLVAANYNSNTISVLRNTSVSGSITGSSFANKVDFASGNWGVAIGDLDGDGKPDLAVTNSGGNTISVLRSLQSTTFVKRIDNEIPLLFSLEQNHPNPFNPSTTISFVISSKSYVTLKVFDIMGREIATVASEELSAGTYSRQWNAANISSGIYFYRLQAGSFTETKKLVLLR
jgi:hypothetical protein